MEEYSDEEDEERLKEGGMRREGEDDVVGKKIRKEERG